MNRTRALILIVVLALIAAAGAFVMLRKGGADAPDDAEPKQTATVTTAPVHAQTVQDVVQVFGTVEADPAATLTIAAPKALIVSRVLVRPGESVTAGQALVEVANAPAVDAAYKQAADAVTFATSEQARVKRLFDERLAASDQMAAADKALADAQAALAAQQKQGASPGAQTLTAPAAGVVTTIPAAPGDHVAQDAPLMSLARAGAAVVKLGLEPTGGHFVAGQAVSIKSPFGGAAIATRISLLGRTADPTTRTIDGIAPLNGAALPIGAAVEAEVTTGAHTGLVAPRAAVVFDETGPHVFTITGGAAHRVFVKVGADQGDDVEISGSIPAGAVVAVEGAYELKDGMTVKVGAPPAAAEKADKE